MSENSKKIAQRKLNLEKLQQKIKTFHRQHSTPKIEQIPHKAQQFQSQRARSSGPNPSPQKKIRDQFTKNLPSQLKSKRKKPKTIYQYNPSQDNFIFDMQHLSNEQSKILMISDQQIINSHQDSSQISRSKKHRKHKKQQDQKKNSLYVEFLSFLPQIINNNSFFQPSNQYKKILKKLIQIQDAPDWKKALKKLRKTPKCSICQKNYFQLVTSCNHCFCLQCYNEYIQRITNGLFILTSQQLATFKPKCKICKNLLNKIDLAKSTPYYEHFHKKSKQRKSHQQSKKSCKQCNLLKEPNQYYQDDTCKQVCTQCLFSAIRKGEQMCQFCCQKYHFLTDLKSKQEKCSSCRRIVNLISDFTLKICDEHLLCYFCLQKTYNEQSCAACDTHLQKASLQSIQRTLFSNCEYCKKEVESPYFIVKKCCQFHVCGICQYQESSSNCLNCKKLLNSQSITLMKTIDESFRKLKKKKPRLFTQVRFYQMDRLKLDVVFI